MLNDCKLNNSCKSGNRVLVYRFESEFGERRKRERDYAMLNECKLNDSC